MFERILIVCDGNICRSPTVAAMLRELKPGKTVSSAGLVGLVGHDMESTARAVAEENGLECGPHTARKLDSELCRDSDLILVMESRQKERLSRVFPEASGMILIAAFWGVWHLVSGLLLAWWWSRGHDDRQNREGAPCDDAS